MHCFTAQQPLVGQGLLIFEASQSHSDTSNSIGLLYTSDQPETHTSFWQQTIFTKERRVHGGIRTHNPRKRAAADTSLRMHTHDIYIYDIAILYVTHENPSSWTLASLYEQEARRRGGQMTGRYLWICERDWNFSADLSARSCMYNAITTNLF